MYRIKLKTASGNFVPVLVNPDIVEEYSENSVQTLHEKNLLLLGEDRFLTTLMLRQFPKRKIIFLPQATCYTHVPEKFMVLLSQRRRWINSTIHNLWELLKVKGLCGVFCFSMHFVILVSSRVSCQSCLANEKTKLDLIGTILLPGALIMLIYFIVSAAIWGTFDPLSVGLVIGALALPALVIIFATGRFSFIVWMIVYILALPIWNLVLPLYAFWHFDDFSW
jgi:chitin synthase